jgi:hypothetical protein
MIKFQELKDKKVKRVSKEQKDKKVYFNLLSYKDTN